MDRYTARKAILRLYAVGFFVFGLVLINSALATDDRVTRVLLLLPGIVSVVQGVGLLFLHWVARWLVPVAFMAGWIISAGDVVAHFSVRDLALAALFFALWFLENRFERLDREIFAPSGDADHPSARR